MWLRLREIKRRFGEPLEVIVLVQKLATAFSLALFVSSLVLLGEEREREVRVGNILGWIGEGLKEKPQIPDRMRISRELHFCFHIIVFLAYSAVPFAAAVANSACLLCFFIFNCFVFFRTFQHL